MVALRTRNKVWRAFIGYWQCFPPPLFVKLQCVYASTLSLSDKRDQQLTPPGNVTVCDCRFTIQSDFQKITVTTITLLTLGNV